MAAHDAPSTYDAEQLDRRMALLMTGSEDGVVRRSKLSGGLSQITLSYEADATTGASRAVVRVPPEFGPLEPYEPLVEATLLTLMARHGVPTPQVLAIESDARVVGRPYFATAFVDGTMSAEANGLDSATAAATATAFVDLLASVHAAPLEQSGPEGSLQELLGHLPTKTPDGLLDRWDAALAKTGIPVPEYHRFLGRWLRAHQPQGDGRLVVVHGDFRLANVLWSTDRPATVAALLDWEEAALGNPLYDLAWLLMGSIEDDDVVYGLATRRALVSAYAERTGLAIDPTDLLWWEVAVGWGLLAMNGLATGYVGDGRYADLRPMLYGYMNRRIAHTLLLKVSAHERGADR